MKDTWKRGLQVVQGKEEVGQTTDSYTRCLPLLTSLQAEPRYHRTYHWCGCSCSPGFSTMENELAANILKMGFIHSPNDGCWSPLVLEKSRYSGLNSHFLIVSGNIPWESRTVSTVYSIKVSKVWKTGYCSVVKFQWTTKSKEIARPHSSCEHSSGNLEQFTSYRYWV